MELRSTIVDTRRSLRARLTLASALWDPAAAASATSPRPGSPARRAGAVGRGR